MFPSPTDFTRSGLSSSKKLFRYSGTTQSTALTLRPSRDAYEPLSLPIDRIEEAALFELINQR